jgi:hypothetical protein
MSDDVGVQQLPNHARTAWLRLRDELAAILGDDLVAIWAFGGTIAIERPPTAADLDTYVIVRAPIDAETAVRIAEAEAAIAADVGVEWDSWYVLEADARRGAWPPHAFRADRRDTTWAINRAHWLAGRHLLLYGAEPADIVPAPTWEELEVDLDREIEHLEAHVAAGDTDPYEATYAVLNGSRILRALETGDVAVSKGMAGQWALANVPDRWHPALLAAQRAYAGEATPEEEALLARDMAAFVAMVRARQPRTGDAPPRWSGS